MNKKVFLVALTMILVACRVFSPKAVETPVPENIETPTPQVIYRSPRDMNLQPQDVPDLVEVPIDYLAEVPLLENTIDQDQRAYVYPGKDYYLESNAIMLLDVPTNAPQQLAEEILYNRQPNTRAAFTETPTIPIQSETIMPVEVETTIPIPPAVGEEEILQWADRAIASSEYSNPGWAASQATGEPDTTQCGDIRTAWASKGTNTVEWIELFYDIPVIPTEINIYQTYNPGHITEVSVYDQDNNQYIVYSANPSPGPACPSTLTIEVDLNVTTSHIRIVVDQTKLNSWAEIDAVGLTGYQDDAKPEPSVTASPVLTPTLEDPGVSTEPITDICQTCLLFWIMEECSLDHQSGIGLLIQHENMIILIIGCGSDVSEEDMIRFGETTCRHVTAPSTPGTEVVTTTPEQELQLTPTIAFTQTPEEKPSPTLELPPAQSSTGSISGALSFPSEGIPALRIVAISTTSGEYYSMDTKLFDDRYHFKDLPIGTYHVYAFSLDSLGFVAGLPGGYTKAVMCGLAYTCTDHSPIDVVIKANQETKGVDILDWFMPISEAPTLPCDPTINYTYDTGTCVPLQSHPD